ncbi:MAG: hypothetical protein AAF456_08075 [Planctomycetota bacterium]
MSTEIEAVAKELRQQIELSAAGQKPSGQPGVQSPQNGAPRSANSPQKTAVTSSASPGKKPPAPAPGVSPSAALAMHAQGTQGPKGAPGVKATQKPQAKPANNPTATTNNRPAASQAGSGRSSSQPTTSHLDKIVQTLEVLITMQEARSIEERASFESLNQRLDEIEAILEQSSANTDSAITGLVQPDSVAAEKSAAGTTNSSERSAGEPTSTASSPASSGKAPGEDIASTYSLESLSAAGIGPESQASDSATADSSPSAEATTSADPIESESASEAKGDSDSKDFVDQEEDESPSGFASGNTPITDWASQKRSILADYGFEDGESDLTTSRALKKPADEKVEEKPEKDAKKEGPVAEGEQSEAAAEKQGDELDSVPDVSDAEVAQLKEQLRQKIREAEVELSIKRTKLEQREAKIEEQTAQLQQYQRQSTSSNEPESPEDGMLGRLKKHLQAFSKPKDGEGGQ